MKSGINPFDSQEAKPYKNNPEILAMTNLVRWACNTKAVDKLLNLENECVSISSWIFLIYICIYIIYAVVIRIFLLVVWLICSAYQNNDITEFEKILKTNRETIMEDPFIREHIEGELITAFTLSVP